MNRRFFLHSVATTFAVTFLGVNCQDAAAGPKSWIKRNWKKLKGSGSKPSRSPSHSSAKPVKTRVLLQPNPPHQGTVPFVAEFKSLNSDLLSVELASQYRGKLVVTLLNPANPQTAVPLQQKQKLTPEQMKELFGSATPKLPVKFVAVVSKELNGKPDLSELTPIILHVIWKSRR